MHMTNKRHKSENIVFLVPNLAGGVGRVMTTLAIALQEQNIPIEIWTIAHFGEYIASTETLVPIRHIGNGRARNSLQILVQTLRTDTPRVVVAVSFHINCLLILAALFLRTKPRIIITEHWPLKTALQELSVMKRIMVRLAVMVLYPLADAYAAVSEGVAKQMARYGHVAVSKILVTYNPIVSQELYSQSKQPVSHPFFACNAPVIVSVGRLSKEKDIATLIHAFALVNKDVDCRLLIVGDGLEKDNLKQIIATHDLQDHIAMAGFVPNPYPYIKHADVLVLPSQREGLPTVLVEALALGTKVVSTDCDSGPREILKNGIYGILTPVGDAPALAQGILTTLREHTTKAVSDAVLAPYTIDTVRRQYQKLLGAE